MGLAYSESLIAASVEVSRAQHRVGVQGKGIRDSWG